MTAGMVIPTLGPTHVTPIPIVLQKFLLLRQDNLLIVTRATLCIGCVISLEQIPTLYLPQCWRTWSFLRLVLHYFSDILFVYF